ncbi:MAG: alpha/beta fold hydrolase [Candidatus Omnitrophica bacterium]|nr:alpha/beta fold hydrolase [Candidatus Omnitrophota bacterium]
MEAFSEAEGSWGLPASGQRLFARLLIPEPSQALLILVHGFGDHGGRHLGMARWLAQQGLAVAVPDLPGHGRSEGPRGHLPSLAACVEGLSLAARQRWMADAGQPRFSIFGHSFGGLVAASWVLRRPESLHRAVLQAPLFEAGFPIPGWKRAAAAALGRWWPSARLSVGLDPQYLSHDPAVVEAYRRDPLVQHAMSAGTYRDMLQTRDEALAQAPQVRVPVLLLCAGDDRVVSTPAAQRWFAGLRGEKRVQLFPGAYHELHHEPVREQAWKLVKEWIVALGLLVACAGTGWAQPQEGASGATDWPAMITKLRGEVHDHPGFGRLREQLATAHNNYGVQLASAGQWRLAQEQLQQAIELDGGNEQFRQNLASVYLREAQQLYEQRQGRDARTRAEEAVKVNPQLAQGYALIGQIEYEDQRLKEARAAWQQALQLDPALTELADRLSRLDEELPVESGFQRISQAFFDLRYEEQLERPVGFDIRDALLEARRTVGGDFAYWPKHKIVVLLYSAEIFRQLRQETPEWVAGQYDGKIRIPLPNTHLDEGMVKQILFHEYTHAVVHDLARDKCPVWFNEGLAEHEGARHGPRRLERLIEASATNAFIPWEELDGAFSMALPVEHVSLAYQQSRSIVAYLVERYGFWRIRRLLEALAGGDALLEAMSREFRTKPARLEAQWRAWLPGFLKSS